MEDKAKGVLAALGGKENIKELDSCITRLRLVVHDPKQVDEKRLRSLGAIGVMRMGTAVQVVFGTTAEQLEKEIKRIMQG